MRGYLLFEITGYPLIIFMSEILNGMVFYVKEIYHVMIILLLRAYIHGIVEWWIRFFLVYFLTLWHNISKKFLQERGICK